MLPPVSFSSSCAWRKSLHSRGQWPTNPHIHIEHVDKAEGADRLSAILRAIAEAQDKERISIGDLLEALKRRALGALMFIFAIITALPMPPGVSAVVGAPLVFLTAQLMLGMNAWLPKIITDRSLSRVDFTRVVNAAAPWLARAESIMKPRFEFLAKRPAIYVVGFVAFFMALLGAAAHPGRQHGALDRDLHHRAGPARARRHLDHHRRGRRDRLDGRRRGDLLGADHLDDQPRLQLLRLGAPPPPMPTV